jgi:4-hydroxybenzoate polyprenyltransferase
MTETANINRFRPARLSRYVSCIRWDEVFVLQGAPLFGAIFSLGALTTANVLTLAIFAIASCCLVAHVYAFNDWSGVHGDLKDANRAARTFPTTGVSRSEFGVLVAALLAVSLLLFALLGRTPLLLALGIATAGALYSAPIFPMKGHPVFGSLLHFVGATLQFALGYVLFAPIDARSIAIGSFFGLVFAAGHCTHEARDCEADQVNGIRTKAVVFGKTRSFLAGLALFTTAYILLVTLALLGIVPRVLVGAAALIPVHLHASFRAMRAGRTYDSLHCLQRCYRLLYAIIGSAIVVSVWLNKTV